MNQGLHEPRPEIVLPSRPKFFPILVPVEVQICPYCKDSVLVITGIDCFTKSEGEFWVADGLELECPNEDPLDENDHTYMPYVHWLPAHEEVLEWINKKYKFDLDAEERQRKLKPADFLKWNEK